MSRVIVAGMGAVSPAGWGAAPLCEAADARAVLPTQGLERPGAEEIAVRGVPAASREILSRFRHPRLRRVSAISRYGVVAALEALEDAAGLIDPASDRIGVVFCSTCGCVAYSRRFYHEALEDPQLASPMLFPETVFNAPSSHLSALLENAAENYTMVGDSGSVAQGVAMAAQWLLRGSLDACLVVAAEECDWLVADAFRHFSDAVPTAEGAGALALTLSDAEAPALVGITDPHQYSWTLPRAAAVRRMRDQLPACESDTESLLSGGATGASRGDRAESEAWSDWRGRRIDPQTVTGHGFAAGAMWQMVTAVNALRAGAARRSLVSLPGAYQFAIGAEFSI